MAARMTAHVLGVKGEPQPIVEHVLVPKFPRWLPKWLRRRWMTSKRIEIEVTPWLVFPDMTWIPPDFGAPVRTVTWTIS